MQGSGGLATLGHAVPQRLHTLETNAVSNNTTPSEASLKGNSRHTTPRAHSQSTMVLHTTQPEHRVWLKTAHVC
eukprot:1157116-Pelagomonas_calceolata.AAC.7